ncbi:hypothetical protein BDV19DRAFT_385500 [Aspergillus venezuelensis]
MASNMLATRLLTGFLFALALFLSCFCSPAPRDHYPDPFDELFPLENATLLLDPRDVKQGENLLHFLSKRAPPKTVEEAARRAESELLCYFRVPDQPTQAAFTEDDLTEYYSEGNYYDKWASPPDGIPYTGHYLAKEMKALKLPTKLGDRGLTSFYWVQDKEFTYNGREYEDGTQGYYKGIMSVDRGFISAEDNESPAHGGGPRPSLYRMSDVYFLEWQRQAGNSNKIKKLRYFLRFHIENTDTLPIIEQITRNGAPLKEWPGTEYTIYKKQANGDYDGSDEGKALLRTPNGVGVAHFLLTNKKVLGMRVPESVRLWKSEEGWKHMLFHIVEYKGI